MTYRAFLKNLDARGMFRIRPSLRTVRKVLRSLGNPQDAYPTVHIAGTNGKGSVAAALESALRAGGYRTGLYTSPHLIDLRERIQLAGSPASGGFLAAARDVLRAERREKCSLTYFELLTAIAFRFFALQKVDIAIIECGLGGKWDATNAIQKPLLSIITSIGLDHTAWLGNSELQIAGQKAGIIKRGVPVVSGVRGKGKQAIVAAARLSASPITEIDTDFRAIPLTASWQSGSQTFSFLYKGQPAEVVPFGLLGQHQSDNAGIAAAALMALKDDGFDISDKARNDGFRAIRWPGRLQVIRKRKTPLVLDGAHNPPAIGSLLRSLETSPFKNARKTFVFSVFKDKDIKAITQSITPLASEICLTPLPKPRGAGLDTLRQSFAGVKGPVRSFPDARAALDAAVRDTPKDGVVIVTGSLVLVGQVLKLLASPSVSAAIHA